MSRRKLDREPEARPSFIAEIKEETKHGVLAIISFVLGLFFLLSSLGYAGVAGRLTFKLLYQGLGIGFFLFPITCALLGIGFLHSIRPNFFKGRLIGGAIFFLAATGLLGSLGKEENWGGLLGQIISLPLLKIFDFYLTLVVLVALMIVAMLVIFDTRFSLEKKLFGWSWRKPGPENTPDNLALASEALPPPELEPTKGSLMPIEKRPLIKPEREEPEDLAGPINWAKKQTKDFTPPPLSLLEPDRGKPVGGDIKFNANIIKRTLANFGIMVEMDEVTIGPSITRYALKPAEGVKLSRLVALQNDLSLALAAHPLRIEAPIPGKSLVGIEIPNSTKSIVGLASILSSNDFTSSPHPLLFSLGRGIS
ncbi:MAG: DNA translocase FtsK 4TM domain-containing protein, partial [Patescibacteria group bacterium]